MKSIVQRDTGESYQDYLQGLAEAAGMVEPTAAELARFDRRRQGRRTSNQDWKSPHDEEARITKLKDGRTHFAYKAEHAADLETGVVTAVVIAAGEMRATRPPCLKRWPRLGRTRPSWWVCLRTPARPGRIGRSTVTAYLKW